MNGFRVECQQLGTARTETVARPAESVAALDTPRSCIA